MWYQKFNLFLMGLRSLISKPNHCVQYKHNGGPFLVITIYRDMLFFGNNTNIIHDLKCHLLAQFDMKDLGDEKIS